MKTYCVFFSLLAILSGCSFSFSTYPLAPLLLPIMGGSTNSISVPSYFDIIQNQESRLKELRIGVLSNRNRSDWNSKVDGQILDTREDENKLLCDFLLNSGLFKDVILKKNFKSGDVDYIISCNVDCIYTIELDGFAYTMNCLTLGIGFLLGVPYQDSSAFYVAEAIVRDGKNDTQEVLSGSLSENYKVWRYDNIYWRPDFYGYSALKPLFNQILFDFITRSGCLQK